MIEESNKLDEVVVTGRQITRTTDKVLYFPSKEQLRHASDGYKALALMMIPTLDVDPFTKRYRLFKEKHCSSSMDGKLRAMRSET